MLIPKAYNIDPADGFHESAAMRNGPDISESFGRDMQILKNSLSSPGAQNPDMNGEVYGYTRNNIDDWAAGAGSHHDAQNGHGPNQSRNDGNTPGNNTAENTDNQQQIQAAKANAVKTQETLQANGNAPSPDTTAKTGEAKTASEGGKQEAEQARKDVAEAKEAAKQEAGAEEAAATSPTQMITAQGIAHCAMAAGGAMIGAPVAAGVVSTAMTAHAGICVMQTPEAHGDGNNADQVEELEREEQALSDMEEEYDNDLSDHAERENNGIESIDGPIGMQVDNAGMLKDSGIAFAPGNAPVQATNDLWADIRAYGEGGSDSGNGEASSTFDPSLQQIYQLGGGPDVMTIG